MDDFNSIDRDQQILSRLAHLEHKVDSIDQTSAFALRADAERHFESVKQIFGRSTRRVQVYLAANGRRSVTEISSLLDMRQSNVSTELSYLQNEGLLEISNTVGNLTYWNKKTLDKTIRISYLLKKEYGLNDDGLRINQ